jgi:uncharacterized protein (TIGR03086 family)
VCVCTRSAGIYLFGPQPYSGQPRPDRIEKGDTMTDQIENCRRALDGAAGMIASLSNADLEKPTPCEGWDVRALLDHMIGVVQNFNTAFGGTPLTPATGQSVAGLAGDAPAATYRQSADALMAALRQPGALDKTIALPAGEMPGARAIMIVIGDQSIHTWDLAKALGKPFRMDEDLAKGILALLHHILTPDRRGAGKAFAEEVPCPESAPVQERLLAFSGRQP